jgi:hypothetical protein
MFCPKCGSKNTDEIKFCRGCGSDVSNVLALVGGRPGDAPALAEKHIDLYSSALRGLITGFGLLTVAIVAFVLSPRLMVLVPFALAFASIFLGAGISRLVKAKAMKRLLEPKPPPSLSPGETDYIKPASIYQTDDLAATPTSITENTTKHLK